MSCESTFEEGHKQFPSSLESTCSAKVRTNSEENNLLHESVKKNDWSTFEERYIKKDAHKLARRMKTYNQCITDMPGQSSRELNPYWKGGGCGLPATEIHSTSNKTEDSREKRKMRVSFIRPTEDDDKRVTRADGQKNWMKKGAFKSAREEGYPDEDDGGDKCLTDEELNALAAKMVKAEMLGKRDLVDKLKSQLNKAKESRKKASGAGDRKNEMILLMSTNRKGLTTPIHRCPVDSAETSVRGDRHRKRRLETHSRGERVRYFADDEKYSLRQMFEREKLGTSGKEERLVGPKKKRSKSSLSDEDEATLDAVRFVDSREQAEGKEMLQSKERAKREASVLKGCLWCPDSKAGKCLVVSTGEKCYLSLPEEEPLTEGHCLLVPLDHTACGTQLDEDVWAEMQQFRKRLIDMFASQQRELVFFENARGLRRLPHMVLHCVPLDKELGDLAPIYFKKALLDSEKEWSTNRKVIDFRKKDVRRSIPKGLPYFSVEFGTDLGFGHVIEDENIFPANFAQEIIGGMLDMDPRKWRKPRKLHAGEQRDNMLKFLKQWKSFCVDLCKNRERRSSSSSSTSSE